MGRIGEESKMPRFRKNPVVIDAVQWTGENLREVVDFCGGLHASARKLDWEAFVELVKNDGLKIFTLEGPLRASSGDWVIRGIHGENYPVKNDIFLQTYEEIPHGS